MAHLKQESVRTLYGHACGYCGVSEIGAGGLLTVDHYQPVSAGGDDADDNLVYACPRCNMYKSDYWPSQQDRLAGEFVLHPLRHDRMQHIRENEITGEWEPLTPTGQFHIELLYLNRPQLVSRRQRSWMQPIADEIRDTLRDERDNLQAEIEAYARYVDHLERLLGFRAE